MAAAVRRRILDVSMADTSPRSELDSHADTTCIGRHSVVLYETDHTVEVEGFLSSLGTVRVPVVTAAIAYDDPHSYTTYILVIHQALFFKQMTTNLICPNQLRHHGLVVNDTPLRFLSPECREPEAHRILIPEASLSIDLQLHGVISYFHTRKPTQAEINDCIHLEITSDGPWDPYDIRFNQDEDTLRSRYTVGAIQTTNTFTHPSIVDTALRSISSVMTEADVLRSINAAFPTTMTVAATKQRRRSPTITAEELASKWRIGIETARRTLEATTQLGVRDFTSYQGTRRLKHSHYQLKYRRLRDTVYTDTMYAAVPSWRTKNKFAQVYSTSFGWVWASPMQTKGDAHHTLSTFHRRFGIPSIITSDAANELISGEFKRKCQSAGTHLSPAEPYTPNQSLAESAVRELKMAYRRAMRRAQSPEVLWDHCISLQAEIRTHTALSLFDLDGEVPETVLSGDTPDISHLCEFEWYEFVWFLNPTEASMDRRQLGRYLGPSFDVGQAMCSKVITEKGTVLSRTSVFPLSDEDKQNEEVKSRLTRWDDALRETLKNQPQTPAIPDDIANAVDSPSYEYYEDDDTKVEQIDDVDEFDHEAYDKYISSRVVVPRGGMLQRGTVKARKRDNDGNLIGRTNPNPILDTSLYDVEFEDGSVEAIAANQIAENIYSRIDDEGHEHVILKEIIDHRKDGTAVAADDGTIVVRGREVPRKTTKGWFLCVEWKDGSTSWVPLRDLKDSNPIEVAEYAAANKLLSEPAFAWWARFAIRQRDRVIKAANRQGTTRYQRREEKFGIEVPKTVQRALEIDRESNTTVWIDAIRKEMNAVGVAFKILPEGSAAPVGHQQIPCHMIFDVKMDFTRKARLVAGGHVTEPPASITYASVVSRDSVRIALTLAALNDLDIIAGDIGNAYLNAPCREKVYTVCGPEFGSNQGRFAVIVRALYGLKSSGASWRAHLAATLREKLGFTPCRADGDVWMRKATKADGEKYYEYLLVYTDDILIVSTEPRKVMSGLEAHYRVKPTSIKEPDMYLGSDVGKYTIPDDPGKQYWYMSSHTYVKEAVRNVKKWVTDNGHKWKTNVSSVLPSGYRPELDATAMCDDNLHSVYYQHIGVLRWAVELGRIDIAGEVSMLSSYLAAPRIGHVEAVLHIFAYLAKYDRSRVVFDAGYKAHEPYDRPDWADFYPDAREAIPPDAPEPRGKPVQLTCFVDADHAGDRVTRRSRTGVLIYLNRSPITWFSKRQNSVETSTFGSEFVALKVATEMIVGLRYKLRMMGVPLDGAADVFVDNQSVVYNTSLPESTLKKKSNAIAYHYVRENAAADVIRIRFIRSEDNLADMLTKIQPGTTRRSLAGRVLY